MFWISGTNLLFLKNFSGHWRNFINTLDTKYTGAPHRCMCILNYSLVYLITWKVLPLAEFVILCYLSAIVKVLLLKNPYLTGHTKHMLCGLGQDEYNLRGNYWWKINVTNSPLSCIWNIMIFNIGRPHIPS